MPPLYSDLTADHGDALGKGLARFATESDGSAAVAAWLKSYPALTEFSEEHQDWFRSLIILLADKYIAELEAKKKSVAKLTIGASLSQLDMYTDISMVLEYEESPATKKFGQALLTMVLICVFLQVTLALIQGWGHNKRQMTANAFLTLLGLKPAADAFRVARGAKQEAGQVIDPLLELVCTKCAELFCEGIPGCILQCYVFLISEKRTGRAVTSILVSAAAAGFASALISYDLDINATQRKNRPKFYGYIPDEIDKRAIMFSSMFINSMCLLLLRSISCCFLLLVDSKYLFYFFGIDHAIYFIQKIARDDFSFWVPVHGMMGVFVAVLMRFINKVIVDFTGMIDFRDPVDLGGVYWSADMVLAVVFSFGSVFLYFRQEVESPVIGASTAWTTVGILSGIWCIGFVTFLMLMKPEYRKTFYSTQTGRDAILDFWDSDDDAVKAAMMNNNRALWKSKDEEVRAWLEENWERWKVEKPDWFDDLFRSAVDDDLLPPAELRRQKMAGGGNRRRSSLGEKLLGKKTPAAAKNGSQVVPDV
jgi:hypothetical protein